MRHTTLTRHSHHTATTEQGLTFLGRHSLKRARAHEATGPARHLLALLVAAAGSGPVFWVAPRWSAGRLYGPGMARFVDPGRFIFVDAGRAGDVLWTLEEVMRAGVAGLVVGDLPAPPGLTPVRRLHLAGEAGAARGKVAPLALLLTPEGAAPGVESRWHMAPAHGPGVTDEAWQLTRSRARGEAVQSWQLRPEGAGLALTRAPVPEAMENF